MKKHLKKFLSIFLAFTLLLGGVYTNNNEFEAAQTYKFHWYDVQRFLKPLHGQRLSTSIKWVSYNPTFQGRSFSAGYCLNPDLNQYGPSNTKVDMKLGGSLNGGKWGKTTGDMIAAVIKNGYAWKKYYQESEKPSEPGWAEKRNFYVTQFAIWSFICGWTDKDIDSLQLDKDWCNDHGCSNEDLGRIKKTIKEIRANAIRDAKPNTPSLKPSKALEKEGIEVTLEGSNAGKDDVWQGQEETAKLTFTTTSPCPDGTQLKVNGQVVATASGGKITYKGIYLGDKYTLCFPPGTPVPTKVDYKIDGAPVVFVVYYLLPPGNYQKIGFPKLEAYTVKCTGRFTNGDIPTVKKNSIIVHKVDENKKALAGAVFELSGPDGFKTTGTTNDFGSIEFNDLPDGNYTLKEIQAPEGYELSDQTWSIKLPTDNGKAFTVEVENRQEIVVKYHLTVIKKNEDGDRLQGVKFKCWTESGYYRELITDENGIADFDELCEDIYYVQEMETIPGYTLNPQVFKVVIPNEENDPIVYLNVVNEQNRDKAQIKKVDADTKKPLPGAKFRITGPQGFDKEFVSDENGLVNLDNLAAGDYTVQEIKAPEGYNLATRPYYFTISHTEPNQFEHVLENVPIKNKVKIKKVDEVTGDPLPGAEFTITGPDGYVRTDTTNELGYIDLGEILYGDYTITEIKAPEGYQMQIEPTTFSVTKDGQEYTIKIKNKKIVGGIILYKTDAETGEKLRNAKFRVQGPKGFDEVMTTDRDGIIRMDFAVYGTYKVQEVEAPEGYVVNPTVHTIEITEHNSTHEIRATNKKAKGMVIIDKVDDIEQPVPGATFELKGKDSDYLKTGVTDQNGHLEFTDVPYGMYQLRETDAPDGFVLDDSAQNFTLSEDKQSFEYTYINRRSKGQLIITKIDEDTKEPLKGAKFEIRQGDKVIKTVTTGETGVASIEQLPYGRYTIVEIEAPPGYLLNTTPQEVFIEKDAEVYKVTMKNKAGDGNIEVIKTEDGSGKKLADAEFAVYDKTLKQVDTIVTNSEGVGVSSKLPVGTYYIQETRAPYGYKLDPTRHPIVIGEEGRVIRYTMTNEQLKGKIRVIKTDGVTTYPVKGVKFEVYEKSKPGVVVDTIVTDEQGKAITKDLPLGDYILKEVDHPDGYYDLEDDFNVTINRGDQVVDVNIVNQPIVVEVSLDKISDVSGKSLPGAGFQLYKDGRLMTFNSNNSAVTTLFTDRDGKLTFPQKLGIGKYKLVETIAPEGYLPAEPIEFEITKETKDDIHFTVMDKQIKGNVKLVKVDEDTDKPMKGITFELHRAKTDALLGEYTTDVNGEIFVDNLEYGEYYFKEVSAPHGYVLDKSKLYFMIQKDGQTIVVKKTNKVIDGDLELLKVDQDTGEPLANAKFKLINVSENKSIGLFTTDDTGIIRVNDLPFGKYCIKEVASPEGYKTDGEPMTFYIQQHGELITLKKYNKKIRGKLEITKTDISDGELIPDCGFRIYASDKKTILIEGKTDGNGIAEFELDYGKYYYQEFDAPVGYVLDNNLYPFEIKEDGEIIKAHMTNKLVEGIMELTKRDISTGDLLPDAKFVIYDEDKNVVVKGTTDENGIARFKLKYGKYYYQEFEAPGGYKVDHSLYPFEIKVDGDIVKCQMTNKPESGNLVLNKVDAMTGKGLQGATFGIYSSKDNKKILEGVTNENGELVIAGLGIGDYYAKELKAPAGYQTVTEPFNFSICKDGETVELKVCNYPYGKDIGNIWNPKPTKLSKTGTAVVGISLPTILAGVFWFLRRKL